MLCGDGELDHAIADDGKSTGACLAERARAGDTNNRSHKLETAVGDGFERGHEVVAALEEWIDCPESTGGIKASADGRFANGCNRCRCYASKLSASRKSRPNLDLPSRARFIAHSGNGRARARARFGATSTRRDLSGERRFAGESAAADACACDRS